MQKMHCHGTDGNRYFWNIKTDLVAGEYRSRCATAQGVRRVLTRIGHKVKSVSAARARLK